MVAQRELAYFRLNCRAVYYILLLAIPGIAVRLMVFRTKYPGGLIIEKFATFSTCLYDRAMKQRPDATHIIRAKRQLAALASPVRQEIVDVLSKLGAASVADIAAPLNRPADALYYHLRVLKKSGLVVPGGYRTSGKRREELFQTVSPDMKLHYELADKGNRRALTAIVGPMLRLGMRDFRRAVDDGRATVSGSGRELWALRQTGWLTEEALAEVNETIERLRQAVSNPCGNGRLYAISVLLTPLDSRSRSSNTVSPPQGRKDES